MSDLPVLNVKPMQQSMTMLVVSLIHWFFAALCVVLLPLVTYQLLEAGLLVSGVVYGLLTLVLWRYLVGVVVAIPALLVAAHLLTRHKHMQAQKMLRGVLGNWKRLPLAKDMHYLTLQSNLALSYLACGDNHQAELVYDEIITEMEKSKRFSKNVLAGVYYNNFACLHLYNRDFEAAERFAEKALSIWRSAKPGEQAGCAYPLANLLEIYLERGELDLCRSTADQVLALCTQPKQPAQVVPESRIGVYIQALLFKGIVDLKQGRSEEAEAVCAQILRCHESGMTPPFNYSVPGLRLFASEFMAIGQHAKAEELLDLGYEILREHPFHGNSAELIEVYEKLLIDTGRSAEVADMKNWVRPGKVHLLKAAL